MEKLNDLKNKFEETTKYFAEDPKKPSEEFCGKVCKFYNAAMTIKGKQNESKEIKRQKDERLRNKSAKQDKNQLKKSKLEKQIENTKDSAYKA